MRVPPPQRAATASRARQSPVPHMPEGAALGLATDDDTMRDVRPPSEKSPTPEAPSRRRDVDGEGRLRDLVLPTVAVCVLFVSLFLLVFVDVVAWWLSTRTWRWPGAGG